MYKILVVDDDSTTTLILKTNLAKLGYEVETANSAINGAEKMKVNDFSLVITDINMPEISGLDFLLWVKKHNPKSQVIIMTGYGSPEIQNFANKQGAVKFFEKPVNIKDLDEFIKKNQNQSFSALLNEINLFDFIQMILLSGKQKLIEVSDKTTKHSGKLFIKAGNIIHAEFNNLEGQIAFNSLIKIKNGSFSEKTWYDPVTDTIKLSSNELLLEASRIINQENSLAKINQDIPGKEIKTFAEKILIVDDDPITPLIIERFLVKKGFTVATAGSAMEGAEILRKENFSLVITDLNMPEVNGLEFLLWIKQYNPKLQVIIITAGGSNEVKKFANQKGAVGYFEKPVNLKELDNFIIKNVLNKGFSGDIHDIDLLDFIQIIAFSGKNKLISVIDPVISQQGLIYLKNGHIIHASCQDQVGEKAFFKIIDFKSGIFSDLPWIDPEEKTINSPITALLRKVVKIKSGEIENEKREIKPEQNKNLISTEVVRAVPRYLEKALAQREALEKYRNERDTEKRFTIYEAGVVFGIVIGRTDKDEVISIMKEYSNVEADSQKDNQMILFDDISFTILFNEENIVEEFTFGRFFTGETSLGIKIDDTIEKAITVYGKPKTCTIKGAVWDNMAFFSSNNKNISTIRLRNLAFFNLNSEKLVKAPEIKALPEPVQTLPANKSDLNEYFKPDRKEIAQPKAVTVKPFDRKMITYAHKEPSDLSNNKAITKKSTKLKQKKDIFSELDKTKELIPKVKKSVKIKLKKGIFANNDTNNPSSPKLKKSYKVKNFTIYESGKLFNLMVNGSTFEDVKKVMADYSKESGESKYSKNMLSYEDLSLKFLFDKTSRLKEVNIGQNFPGETEKGLKIGDSIDKALEIYGMPLYQTNKSAIWKKFAVFLEESDKISSIRLNEK